MYNFFSELINNIIFLQKLVTRQFWKKFLDITIFLYEYIVHLIECVFLYSRVHETVYVRD